MSASLASNLASLWHFESGGIAYDCAVRALQSQKGRGDLVPRLKRIWHSAGLGTVFRESGASARRPSVGSDRFGFHLCYRRMLLLTRVIGRINVSYPEWPLTMKLNDGRTACPTVVVHFGRCFGVSARR
jgi:hypothetical protein